MTIRIPPIYIVHLLLALVAVFADSPLVNAGGFENYDLSLRLPAALSRFSPYSDVAGIGGASAGSRWSSSINPASTAWQNVPGDLHLDPSVQYSAILFDHGPTLNVVAESLTWQSPGFGTFQPSAAQAFSGTAPTRLGLDMNLTLDQGQLQWADKIGDNWAVGANFNYASSDLNFKAGPLTASKSHSDTYDFRFGVLNQPMEHLLLGLVADYGFSPSHTTIYDIQGLGFGILDSYDVTHQVHIRPGMSYEYLKDSVVYFDYQYGIIINRTGQLETHDFFFGADQRVYQWLFVRAGMAVETRGNLSGTAGLGIYPNNVFTIDIGYQFNMFPELRPELGGSQLIGISVAIAF